MVQIRSRNVDANHDSVKQLTREQKADRFEMLRLAVARRRCPRATPLRSSTMRPQVPPQAKPRRVRRPSNEPGPGVPLTDERREQILSLIREGHHSGTIRKICRCAFRTLKRLGYVSSMPSARLTDQDRERIADAIRRGHSNWQLYQTYGVSPIWLKKFRKELSGKS